MFGAKEKNNYSFLYCEISDDKLRQRVKLSMDFYIEKANEYRVLGMLFSILSICLPSLGTYASFVTNYTEEEKVVIAGIVPLITALTTIVTGIIALFKISEKKTSYRNSAETMKSELMNYYLGNGNYKDVKDKDFVLQVNIEKIIQDGYSKIRSLEETKK